MINIFEPKIGNRSLDLLAKTFKSNWLGRGSAVSTFEDILATFLRTDRNDICTVASCSDAIFASLRVLRLQTKSRKIAIPTNSFPVLLSSCQILGFEPVLIDIDEHTGLIDLDSLSTFKDDLAAVFYTNYGNKALHGDVVRSVVSPNTKVYVDNACALGAFWEDGTFVGSECDFCCYSFDAMKLVVCGEGGCAFFRDKHEMDLFRSLTYLGLPPKEKSGLDSAQNSSEWWEYDVTLPGLRSVFTNINASIGIPEIENVTRYLDRKSEIKNFYDYELANIEKLKVNNKAVPYKSSNYFYTIQCDARNELAQFLLKNGVYTTLRYHPLNQLSICRQEKKFPGTDEFFSKSLNIPIHHNLNDDDVNKIVGSLKDFFCDR